MSFGRRIRVAMSATGPAGIYARTLLYRQKQRVTRPLHRIVRRCDISERGMSSSSKARLLRGGCRFPSGHTRLPVPSKGQNMEPPGR